MKLELGQQFETQIDQVRSDYEAKLSYLQAIIDEQSAIRAKLELDLAAMKELQNETDRKYETLKIEFSNFIDQVPGFKGEFILK